MSTVVPAPYFAVTSASWRLAEWSRYPRPATSERLGFLARQRVVSTTFDLVTDQLPHHAPTGGFMSYVIGKPSHDKTAHPGTRVEADRFGHSVWHCPQPCGARLTSLKKLHAHVLRKVATSYHKDLCPVTVAKLAAEADRRRAAAAAALSPEALEARIAELLARASA